MNRVDILWAVFFVSMIAACGLYVWIFIIGNLWPVEFGIPFALVGVGSAVYAFELEDPS
jgi:hypothetical protein